MYAEEREEVKKRAADGDEWAKQLLKNFTESNLKYRRNRWQKKRPSGNDSEILQITPDHSLRDSVQKRRSARPKAGKVSSPVKRKDDDMEDTIVVARSVRSRPSSKDVDMCDLDDDEDTPNLKVGKAGQQAATVGSEHVGNGEEVVGHIVGGVGEAELKLRMKKVEVQRARIALEKKALALQEEQLEIELKLVLSKRSDRSQRYPFI